MKFKIGLLSILLFYTLYLACPAGAGAAGSTSFEFLLIPVGAREAAISAGTAVTFNPNAFWWNPAGLAYIERHTVSLTYNEWFENINRQRAGYTFPIQGRQAGALNISMLTINDIEGYDWYATPTGKIISRDYFLSYTQAKHFSNYLAGGISLKALFEQLDDESGYGAAIDAGIILNPYDEFWIAAGIRNAGIGSRFISDKALMPVSFFGGAGLKLNKFTLLAGDISYLDEEIVFGAGVEFNLWNLLFLRGGYSSFAGELSDFSLGAGWVFRDIAMDYALVPYGKLGTTHRVDLVFKFGEPLLIEKIYRNAVWLYNSKEYRDAYIEFSKVRSLDRNYKKTDIWLKRSKEKADFTEKTRTEDNDNGELDGQKE